MSALPKENGPEPVPGPEALPSSSLPPVRGAAKGAEAPGADAPRKTQLPRARYGFEPRVETRDAFDPATGTTHCFDLDVRPERGSGGARWELFAIRAGKRLGRVLVSLRLEKRTRATPESSGFLRAVLRESLGAVLDDLIAADTLAGTRALAASHAAEVSE